MRIVNPQISDDICHGRKLRLNLGSGGSDPDGRYTVDHLELPGIDIVADLNSALDALPDNSVSELFTSHTLEHIQNFMSLMHEIHRIVEEGGRIEVIVPHFSCPLGFSDPTHVRFFGLYSMYYFVDEQHQPKERSVPCFYTNIRFRVESVRFHFNDFGPFIRRRLGPMMTRFWNKSFRRLHFYENHLVYLYPVDEIRLVLTPMKSAS